MAEQHEPVPPNINSLSISDFLTVIQHDKPDKELQNISLLYVQQPEIATVLQNEWHIQPKRFAEYFGKSFGPFLETIPKEYHLDIYMQHVEIRERNMLEISLFIASNVVNQLYREIYKQVPTYKQYLEKRAFIDGPDPDMGDAGTFVSYLYADGAKSQPFLASYRKDTILLSARDKTVSSTILPTPLRRSENPDIRLTDEYVHSDTALLYHLVPHIGTFAIQYAVATSTEGETLNRRNGFQRTQQLSIPENFRDSFNESFVKEVLQQHNARAKIIERVI